MQAANIKNSFTEKTMSESVKIEIDLETEYWNDNPFAVEIRIAGKTVFNEKIFESTTVSESVDVNEGVHLIEIHLAGKTDSDTVTDDQGNITNDVMLHVKGIRFDDISVDQTLRTHSKYYTVAKQKLPTLDNHVDLGHNGIWTFEFEIPIYIWLLENLD
jgi:hypothetical protein